MSCVYVRFSSLLWMRRERMGTLLLKPLCLGTMATRAKLRGKKRDFQPFGTVVHLRARQSHITAPSWVWVKAKYSIYQASIHHSCCFSRKVQQETTESPGPSGVSMDRSTARPVGLNEGQPFVEGQPFQKRWGFSPEIIQLHNIHKFWLWNCVCFSPRVKQDRADSPGPSCDSVNTDGSSNHPLQCEEEALSPGEER